MQDLSALFMLMEQILKKQLADLAAAYGHHRNLSLWRVSFLARGDGQFLKNLENPSRTLTLKTFDKCFSWFDENWPVDLEWPTEIPRPSKPEKARRAS